MQLLLVRPIDRCQLLPAHDLQRRAITDIGVGQRVDLGVLLLRELAAAPRGAVAGQGAARLPIRVLDDLVEVAALRIRPFAEAVLGVRRAHRPLGLQAARECQAAGDIGVWAESVLEGGPLTLDEGVEVVGRDELVLGAVDELHELGERELRVVDEVEVRAQVAQEQVLPDAVQHVRPRRHPGLRRRLGQDPMADGVEVRDGQAGGLGHPDGVLDALAELGRGLHVVGEDEQALRLELRLGIQQVRHPLDDDAGLPRPRAGDDDERPLAPLDDPPLLFGQGRPCSDRRRGHKHSIPSGTASHSLGCGSTLS